MKFILGGFNESTIMVIFQYSRPTADQEEENLQDIQNVDTKRFHVALKFITDTEQICGLCRVSHTADLP